MYFHNTLLSCHGGGGFIPFAAVQNVPNTNTQYCWWFKQQPSIKLIAAGIIEHQLYNTRLQTLQACASLLEVNSKSA